jgi:hypothetical protein
MGRGAQGLDVRLAFFEVAAQTFLAVVHAEHQLGSWRRGCCGAIAPQPASMARRQRGEDLLAVMALVGLQPHPGGAFGGEFCQAVEQALGTRRAERGQRRGIDAEMLAEQEQRPGATVRIHRVGGRAVPFAASPRVEQARHGDPVGLALLGGAAGGGAHQAVALVRQPFRQVRVVEGEAHQQFRRMAAQIAAQSRQAGLGLEMQAAQALAVELLQHQAHGEVVGHGDGEGEAGMAGVALTPEHHAGPAGQFLGQAFEVGLPARGLEAERLHRLQDGLDRLFRQALERLFPGHQTLQVEQPVFARARQPRGIEASPALRVVPGGQSLVEVGSQMADQVGTDVVQHVAAGDLHQQAPQRQVFAHASEESGESRLGPPAQHVQMP